VQVISQTSHEILMERFQRSLDMHAFQQIVSYYSEPALGVARQVLSDAVLAEDAVQETFLRVFRRREQYQPAKPFSCWFYTILRNVCTDMLRQQTRHARVVSQMAEWPRTASQPPGCYLEVLDELQTLPASEQTVLHFRILDNLPFRDIAAIMGISLEAAKKRAQRGLRKLRANIYSQALKPVSPSLQPNSDSHKNFVPKPTLQS